WLSALRSQPAEKILSPEAVRIAHQRSGSSRKSAKAFPMSWLIARSIALTLGLFRVTSSTRPRRASSTCDMRSSGESGDDFAAEELHRAFLLLVTQAERGVVDELVDAERLVLLQLGDHLVGRAEHQVPRQHLGVVFGPVAKL